MNNSDASLLIKYCKMLTECIVNAGMNHKQAMLYANSRILLLDQESSNGIIFAMNILKILEHRGFYFQYFFDEDSDVLIAIGNSSLGFSYDMILLKISSSSLTHEIRVPTADLTFMDYKLKILAERYSHAAYGSIEFSALSENERSVMPGKIAENLLSAIMAIY